MLPACPRPPTSAAGPTWRPGRAAGERCAGHARTTSSARCDNPGSGLAVVVRWMVIAAVRPEGGEHVVDDERGHVGRDGPMGNEMPVEERGSEQVDDEVGVELLGKGAQALRLDHDPQQGLTSALSQ